MNRDKIVIGSRGSKLALIYAEKVKSKLIDNCSKKIEIKTIVTEGDVNQKDRLSEVGGKGLFSKNIESELLENKIDLAVHALKDMPGIETKGLTTNCFLERNYPNEILISKDNVKFDKLKSKSIIGTSSYRREYQLKHLRNDLNYKLIRGNVDTRIKKLNAGLYDAIILSKAGIDSLNLNNHITQEFSIEEIIPSAGQGVIAVQCRNDDKDVKEILKRINHEETSICCFAERELLKTLEGDCNTAIGAISTIDQNTITLNVELFSKDGKKRYFIKESKDLSSAKELGNEIGELLKKKSKGSYK
tara:strand:- start:37 stop:945 length:909 start_codon:yes stop_codon:yes gene_type:complete